MTMGGGGHKLSKLRDVIYGRPKSEFIRKLQHFFSSFDAVINFTVSRVNEPLSTIQQYEWAIKGWSKCSKECGGGKQHLVMA